MSAKVRIGRPIPLRRATLDVFIKVCGEQPYVVERTVRAALAIDYPHRTWLLNDGRMAGKSGWDEIDALAVRYNVPCFTRTAGARGKAGNLNYALTLTDCEFIATIDATEEAIVNALVAATTVVGRDGITAHAIPHDRLREVMAAHGR